LIPAQRPHRWRTARGLFDSGGFKVHHVRQQDIPHPSDLAPGIRVAEPLPDPLGRQDRPRARPGDRHPELRRGPQRRRRPWRRLFDLPRAGDLVGRHDRRDPAGPAQHSLDPWGHRVAEDFAAELAEGVDIRPTIAVTKARIDLPEIHEAIAKGRLKIDGKVVHESGDVAVTKAAIDPVWYLPGVAERFEVDETQLRRTLFEQTGGMYPELVTRPDIKVFLPPIGGITLYMFGDPAHIGNKRYTLTCRVHDECNGSDVFGSDICTCRPYLTHGIEEATRQAQEGGTGLIVYNRKEGRALGEVTKFLVYNARKRQPGGDQAATYFERTECVAGVQDARFQQLMPDIIHWLGIRRIDRFVSMSNMKYDALVNGGIEIGERVPIPDDLVPMDASVEMEAKKAAGYFTPDKTPTEAELKKVVGRDLKEF
jgi:GTP cyclohydrolase II